MSARIRVFVASLGVLIVLAFWATRGRTLPLALHVLRADDASLQQIRDLQGQYVVQVFAWSEIEPTRGEFHWEYSDWLVRAAEYYGLRIVARLDKPPQWAAPASTALNTPPKRLEDYSDFVARVAERYRGRIAAYVIWNEPNLAREWGNQPPDPAAYTQLLKLASAQLRAVDPKALILSAGLAPTNEHGPQAMDDRDFLRGMYLAGALHIFDILAAHPYPFAHSPDDPHSAHTGLNFARLYDVRDVMLANGDSSPIWITEFGYPTDVPGDDWLDERKQADWLPRAYTIARDQMPFIELFTVWNLTRESPLADEQASYSLVRPDGSLRPAYVTVRTMEKESPAANAVAHLAPFFSRATPRSTFPVLAQDAIVHLGDSEYPSPWVPLYQTRNPSVEWTGEFYLRSVDFSNTPRQAPWRLTMELMQVNDFDTRVLVNDQPVAPAYLPTEDFTSAWVTAQFQVAGEQLHVGRNTVTLRDGKLFPAFQQLGYTWDDFQARNVVLLKPRARTSPTLATKQSSRASAYPSPPPTRTRVVATLERPKLGLLCSCPCQLALSVQ